MDAFLRTFLRINYCNMLIIIFDTFYVFGIFLGFGNWKSGFRENGRNWLFFDQFQHIGHFSHSVLVTEHDFELRISKFQFSRNFLEFLEIVWKFTNFDHFWKVEHFFHSILVTDFDFPPKTCRFCNFLYLLWLFGNFQIPDSRKFCNMNIFCLYVKKQIIGSILD